MNQYASCDDIIHEHNSLIYVHPVCIFSVNKTSQNSGYIYTDVDSVTLIFLDQTSPVHTAFRNIQVYTYNKSICLLSLQYSCA